MAFLHLLRHGVPGLSSLTLRAALLLSAAVAWVACDAPAELQPDQLLRDSLGLTSRDRVYQVRVSGQNGTETPEPVETVLGEGDYLNFSNGDHRARSIRFLSEGLSADSRAWIESATGRFGPLLSEFGERWIVDFSDAPVGRYPFEVQGGGETGRGVVIVEDG